MANLGVCLETVFTDLPVEERIGKIAEAGFNCVEFWHPEATWDGQGINDRLPKQPDAIAQSCREHGVVVNDFVLNAWDGLYGGCPVKAEDRGRFLEQVHKMIDFAGRIGVTKAAVLSGTIDPALSRAQMRENLENALGEATEIAQKNEFVLLLEPLNTLVDHAGYYLESTAEAVEILRAIDSPHLKLLYDIYHMQIMEGNVIATIEKHIDAIGHFHSAAVPGRGEHFDGELDWPTILRRIDASGYEGGFGLEYFPKMSDPMASLKKVRSYLLSVD